MKIEDLVRELPLVPYEPGGDDLSGMDCFGLVEYWHRHILNIEVEDRKAIQPSPKGFQEGFHAKKVWNIIPEPKDHALIVMRSVQGRHILEHGHCGIYWRWTVLHFEAGEGFLATPWKDIKHRASEILLHEAL